MVFWHRQWWLDDEHKPSPYIPYNQFKMWSKYPFIVRDVTLVADSWEEALLNIIIKGGKYVEKVFFIGTFEPKRSHSFRIIFQSLQRTLTDREVNQTIESII